MVDLGAGTLDAAAVETAAYTLERDECPVLWACKVDDASRRDRARSLRDAVSSPDSPVCFFLSASLWKDIPGCRVLYWVPRSLLAAFANFPLLKELGYLACVGLQTNDDFRFVRVSWEVPNREIGQNKYWSTFFKGGDYCPFFDDMPLLVNWKDDGHDIKQYTISLGNSPSRHVVNEQFYFRAGLAYTNISSIGFSLQPMPAGAVFSIQGQYLGAKDREAPFGILSSRTVNALLDVINPGRHYQAGQVQIVPVPKEHPELRRLDRVATDIAATKREQATWCEESRHFEGLPIDSKDLSLSTCGQRLFERVSQQRDRIVTLSSDLDAESYRAYALDSEGIEFVRRATDRARRDEGTYLITSLSDRASSPSDCSRWLAQGVISVAMGSALGRWRVSEAFSVAEQSRGHDFGSALPVYARAMAGHGPSLEAPGGLDSDGILVYDEEHEDDVAHRVREILEAVWNGEAERVESEACELLGVESLRGYFRKAGKGGFWEEHVRRYSRGRRKAPIFWLLQSSRKNYALWLYYHCIDSDILFKALVNYVEPKIRLEKSRMDSLQSRKLATDGSSRDFRKIVGEIEKLEVFLAELREFENKLRRAAQLHIEPDLNDGVGLNIAMLHELVPWKEASKYWNELLDGKYKWSSIGKQLHEKGLVK